jgi:hypothetical protein
MPDATRATLLTAPDRALIEDEIADCKRELELLATRRAWNEPMQQKMTWKHGVLVRSIERLKGLL